MSTTKLLGLTLALCIFIQSSLESSPVFGDLPSLWTRAYVKGLPTNPPPASIEQSATEPTVYVGSVVPPEGAFRIYSGFARGTLSRKHLIEGNSDVTQELFLIGFGIAPTLQYNEVNISDDGGSHEAFKVTLANYFVFPDGRVERVTQIVIVQPAGDISQPLDLQSVTTLIRNQIEANFVAIPPANSVPPSEASSVHALIVSQGFGLEVAFKPYRHTNLIGGIAALGSREKETQQTSAVWSQNLRIIPDQDLINGARIPPITPNIVDVRIRHYSIQSSMEGQSP